MLLKVIAKVRHLVSDFKIVPFNAQTVQTIKEVLIRRQGKGRRVGLRDRILAALAVCLGLSETNG